MGLGVFDDRIEVLVRLLERLAFRRDIAVVPAPVGGIDLLEKLKSGIHALLGDRQRVLALFPRTHDRARTKRIGAGATERMPVGNAEEHVLLHRLAIDHLGRVVVAKGERIVRARSFVGNRGDARKVACLHRECKVEGVRTRRSAFCRVPVK